MVSLSKVVWRVRGWKIENLRDSDMGIFIVG